MPSTGQDSTHSLVFSTRTSTTSTGLHSHEFDRRDTSKRWLSKAEFHNHIIIPPFNEIRGHEVPLCHAPQYADQWPVGFRQPNRLWWQIWNGQQFELDSFLRYGTTKTGKGTPWIHEPDFRGVKCRLTIDHQKLEGLPTFTEGMIVKCRQWNYDTRRYIIDHCAGKDDINAYLKVICYDEYHNTYDIRFCYPPIILAVPLSHSNVRNHPNLTGETQTSIEICGGREFDSDWTISKGCHQTNRLRFILRRLCFWK